jgi:membrane protein
VRGIRAGTDPSMGKRNTRNTRRSGHDKVKPASAAAQDVVDTLDPTKPRASRAASGKSRKPPAVESFIRRAQGALPGALLRRFVDADLLAQSAALAFYAVLSLAPLLLIVLWLAARWVPGAQEALLEQIGMLAGTDAERVARTIVTQAHTVPGAGSLSGAWSTALLFFGATAVFAQLQDVLNRIFRTDAARLPGLLAWLRKRVFSFGLVFAIGFLLLVSMTINTVLQLAFSRFDWVQPLIALLVSWVVYAVGFALMYHYLPDRRVVWHRALGGGAATALLFLFGRAAIAWYLRHSNPGSAYGSMGTLVLALVWIYYAALIVFIGALFTAVVDERARARASR